MKFLTDINLNKNELQNAVIQNLSTAPENPKVGQVYYNTTDQLMYQYKRTSAAGVTPATYAWLSVGSPEQYFGTVTSITAGTGLTGGTITESGTIAHADTSSQSSITASSRTYINSVTLDGFGHVTALGTGTETVVDTDSYVNQASFANDDTNSNVKMTLTRTGTVTGTVTANIPKVSTTSAGVIPKFASANQSSTDVGVDNYVWDATQDKYAKLPSTAFSDNNTTYTFAGGTNKFTVTPSGGTAQDVTVTPSITRNVTHSSQAVTADNIVTWNANATSSANAVVKDSGKAFSTAAITDASDDTQIPTSKTVYTAISSAISGLGSVLNFKGTKATASELPSTGNTTGDVWIVTADNSEYVWTGTAWEKLGPTIDLSGYLEKSGGTMTGSITMTNSSTITGVPTPTNNSDAANKGYVDSAVGAVDVGVTSVALANATNGGLSISGSPITSTGTITIGLDTGYGDTKNPYGSKTKNYVLAAPTNANGVPTFRKLVADDIPDLSGTYKPLQTAKDSPTASSNATAFIDTISQDANGVITATKKNVNFSDYLKKDGTVAMTGNLNLNSHKITNVTDPESAQDAATKNYVDNAVSTATGGAVFKQTPVPTNPALTASGGAFTWTISSNLEDMIVSVYEIATGSLVYPDISISSSTITIIINDSASVGTLAADTYRAVILGTMPSNNNG